MDNKTYNRNLQKRRRMKYGAFAVGLTAAVVALIIAVNAVFSALAIKNGWYFDMTERDLYTPDPDAMTLLEEYRGSEALDIRFIFCMPEDQLVSDELCNMVNNLLKAYDEEFDFISVEYVDIVNHPQILDKYLLTNTSTVRSNSVIVTNGKNSIVYSIDSFFTSNDGTSATIYALNGDYKIVSAVIRLADDNPIAYFVTNHSEDVSGSALRNLFIDAGYDVRDIDLTKEDMSPDAKVVVINNPKTDFWGVNEAVNEIKKLETLLEGSAGLMVFMDETVNATPVLDDFLENWGVRFERQSIRDHENSVAGTAGTNLIAEYVTEGSGATLTSGLRALSNPPKAVLTKCRPITLLYDGTVGKDFASIGAVRFAFPVLTSSGKAVTSPLDGEGQSVTGRQNLLTITIQQRYKDNVSHNSFVLAGGTSSFSDDAYIGTSSYANRDILFNAMKQFSKKNVPVDINVKLFSDDSLTISAKEANIWTAVCTVLLPAAVAGVGIYVYARRRYL